MEPLTCAMTGARISDSSDGIYEDGEWISWEWINTQLDEGEDPEDLLEETYEREGPPSTLERAELFLELVGIVARYKAMTGRYLEIWGELGEMYAEFRHGLVRHPRHHAGSDGTIDEVLVEVKTIAPGKKSPKVHVKRRGDFEKLLIVRISDDLWFSSKLFDRASLKEGAGMLIRANWNAEGGT